MNAKKVITTVWLTDFDKSVPGASDPLFTKDSYYSSSRVML